MHGIKIDYVLMLVVVIYRMIIFSKLGNIMHKYEIHPANLWNIDEKGF